MDEGVRPAEWTDHHTVVAFPEHVTEANVGLIGVQLLAAISQRPDVVIADLSRTTSCDRAGTDALTSAYQRAVIANVELRVVAAAAAVRRALSAAGLDRLVSVYPLLESARAAGSWPRQELRPVRPAGSTTQPAGDPPAGLGRRPPAMTLNEVVLRQLIDALGDGVALTDDAGTIVLANRQLGAMFGYDPVELVGQQVESLVPAELRAMHRQDRAAYTREPSTRPMGERVRLAGVRKDGGTVPVTITLSPVPTADGLLILAVVRAPALARRHDDLADLVRAAAERADQADALLDRVVRGLFHVGVSLQAAVDQPADLARERITEALRRLDDTIHEIRDHVFAKRDEHGRGGGA